MNPATIVLAILVAAAIIWFVIWRYTSQARNIREYRSQRAKCRNCGLVASVGQFERERKCPFCGSDEYSSYPTGKKEVARWDGSS